jgi:FkbH-like protein/FkbM family methyltransferase
MTETIEQTIAIAATFTAELIEEPLAYWMQELEIQSRIEFAPYNQIFQELLNPSSLMSGNDDGINVVLIRLEDWSKFRDNSINAALSVKEYEEIEHNVHDFIRALKSATERSKLIWIVCVCPVSSRITENKDHSEFFRQMEARIVLELSDVRGVYIVTTSDLNTLYPVSKYDDPFSDKIGHIPFTPEFFVSLATMIARRIFAIRSKPYKVIVLDCDQTLWKGICGEDGHDGVEIDTPHRKLQEFMIERHNTGMLLCLCSKNNEEDVIRVFDRHSEMSLQLGHIVSWRINWKSKPENIKSLAGELHLGLDSFILIDDNPIECAQVQAECPEVLALCLPEEPNDIPRFLNHVWAFDNLKVTTEDKKRTEFYRQNIERDQFQGKSLTFSDFLAGLELSVRISKISNSQISRVAQLTQRTNQFNFTTIRRSERDIQKLCQSEELECLVVEVNDRFGDYGLVGVIMFRTFRKTLEVETFLLSCRVLGRGVEHQMMQELGRIAIERGKSAIDVRYVPTGRNQPALDFLNCAHPKLTYSFGNEFLFRYSAELIESIAYKPDKEESGAQNETGSITSVTVLEPRERRKSALLSRFATELYDVKKIVETIRTEKLKSQKPRSVCYQIEQTLREYTAIRQVAVRFWDDASGCKRLIAYVIADQRNSPVISGHARYLLPNNMAIVHQNKIETDMTFKEIFEDQVYFKHGINICEGDFIFDVGANIGLFTLFVQQVYKNTCVWAFEPVPQLFEMLRINVDLYAPSTKLFNCGLSDKRKNMTLTFHPHLTILSGYYPDAETDDEVNKTILSQQAQGLIDERILNKYMGEMLERASVNEDVETQLVTLSDILTQNNIECINLLKADVERSESDVLIGINEQDWKKINQIVMEVHSKYLLDKITLLLRNHDYHIRVDQQPLLKDTENFMLYAIQQQLYDFSPARNKYESPGNRPLSRIDPHLLSSKELRGYTKKEVPRLTMPLDIMFLDTIPMAVDGQIDDQALPIPSRTNCDLDCSSVEPLTFVEENLCRIWEEILAIDNIGLHDDFFELGGHSLLATQILSRIYDTFKIQLSMARFFDTPTIAGVSKAIEGSKIEQSESVKILAILEELENLSDSEVKTMLVQERGES